MSSPSDGRPVAELIASARDAQATEDLAAVVALVAEAVASGDIDAVSAVLAALRPADRVDVFEQLDLDQQSLLIAEIDDEEAADILEELEDEDAAEVAVTLPPEALAPILRAMESDEAADVLGDLPPDQAESTLEAMDDAVEAEMRALLVFGDETAGGRMTLDYVSLRADDTVAASLAHLRALAPDAEVTYYLYAVDDNDRLVGVVSLRQLVVADPDARIRSLMNTDVISVSGHDDQETAARLMARYDLLALPVVGPAGRMVGVITHDDLVDVLQEEATEDMYRLVGLDELARPLDPVRVSVRRRLPWLALNLGMALALVTALKRFESTMESVPTLAVLFPLVTGQGGNVGTQTMTFVVRSLALGELVAGAGRRLLAKEMAIGLINGLVIGILGGAIALAVAGDSAAALRIASAMALAMTLNLAAGALVGVLVPLVLRRAGLDPAVASSVFVTAITDTLGVLFFLGFFVLLMGTGLP